jgi:hypothetical protein
VLCRCARPDVPTSSLAPTTRRSAEVARGFRGAAGRFQGRDRAFNPDTPTKRVAGCWTVRSTSVLDMRVFPGFGGQKFMPEVLPKVSWLRRAGYRGHVEMDGGLNPRPCPAAHVRGPTCSWPARPFTACKDRNAAADCAELPRARRHPTRGHGAEARALKPTPWRRRTLLGRRATARAQDRGRPAARERARSAPVDPEAAAAGEQELPTARRRSREAEKDRSPQGRQGGEGREAREGGGGRRRSRAARAASRACASRRRRTCPGGCGSSASPAPR